MNSTTTLRKMKTSRGIDAKYIEILEKELDNLTSSFSKRLIENNSDLTPREIEICNMIKDGLSTKEIAGILHLSVQTIITHRRNIREKLHIRNKKENLSTYLQRY